MILLCRFSSHPAHKVLPVSKRNSHVFARAHTTVGTKNTNTSTRTRTTTTTTNSSCSCTNDTNHPIKHEIVFTLGLPGSGKTFCLQRRYDFSKIAWVDLDEEMKHHPSYDPTNPSALYMDPTSYAWANDRTQERLEGLIRMHHPLIAVDGTGTHIERQRLRIRYAKEQAIPLLSSSSCSGNSTSANTSRTAVTPTSHSVRTLGRKKDHETDSGLASSLPSLSSSSCSSSYTRSLHSSPPSCDNSNDGIPTIQPKTQGYKTTLLHVHVPLEIALQRNRKRLRQVPYPVMIDYHTRIQEAVEALKDEVDEYCWMDNTEEDSQLLRERWGDLWYLHTTIAPAIAAQAQLLYEKTHGALKSSRCD